MREILNIIYFYEIIGHWIKKAPGFHSLSMVWEMGKVTVGRPVILQREDRYDRSVLNISTIILLSRAR